MVRMPARNQNPRCWGCDLPLPSDRFGNAHRTYHNEACRHRHEREQEAFRERHPELPGWGRSPVPRAGEGDVVRVVRAPDGRLAARFERGPARRGVVEHHAADTLSIAYYLDAGAGEDDALAFLRRAYPAAETLPPDAARSR